MRVLVVDNAYLYKFNDNYFSNIIYNNSFFERYTRVFETVVFPAKIKLIEGPIPKHFDKLDMTRLEIIELPKFKGYIELIKKYNHLKRILYNEQIKADFIIYRMTQIEGLIAFKGLEKNKPFAIEIVNDIKLLFPLKYLLIFLRLNKILRNAIGVSYLTQNYLQKRYHKQKNINIVSNQHQTIDLENKFFLNRIREHKENLNTIKLIHVANNIDNNIKGHKTVIKAVSQLKKNKNNVIVSFVGDGLKVNEFKRLARKLDVSENVRFLGRVDDRDALIEILRTNDIFLMPSKGEGIGRSIIEAMASGLACIVSNKGGQTELISKDYQINRNDYKALCKKIEFLKNNTKELNKQKKINLLKSQKYRKQFQDDLRNKFYEKLKDYYEKEMVD